MSVLGARFRQTYGVLSGRAGSPEVVIGISRAYGISWGNFGSTHGVNFWFQVMLYVALIWFLQKITPFENFDEAEQTISDLLQLPVKRVAEYQEFIKELIKYAARAKQDVKGLQKALDMLLGVPHRAQDIELLKSIKGYRGNIHKLGRIIKNVSRLDMKLICSRLH